MLQHSDLSLRQRLATFRVKTARVLHARAQTRRKHARADLIVLLVRILGVDSDGSLAEQVDVGHFSFQGGLHRSRGDHVDAVLELAADALAQEEGGEVASIYHRFHEGVWRVS